jgi:hypothetical protein
MMTGLAAVEILGVIFVVLIMLVVIGMMSM